MMNVPYAYDGQEFYCAKCETLQISTGGERYTCFACWRKHYDNKEKELFGFNIIIGDDFIKEFKIKQAMRAWL